MTHIQGSHPSFRQPLNGTTGSLSTLENVTLADLQNLPPVKSHGSRYQLQVVCFYKVLDTNQKECSCIILLN